MANLLQNMLTLQTTHSIPMRMDISTTSLINYYESYKSDYNDAEKERLIHLVVTDLKAKEQAQLERLQSNN